MKRLENWGKTVTFKKNFEIFGRVFKSFLFPVNFCKDSWLILWISLFGYYLFSKSFSSRLKVFAVSEFYNKIFWFQKEHIKKRRLKTFVEWWCFFFRAFVTLGMFHLLLCPKQSYKDSWQAWSSSSVCLLVSSEGYCNYFNRPAASRIEFNWCSSNHSLYCPIHSFLAQKPTHPLTHLLLELDD